jgi:hypothetical protein
VTQTKARPSVDVPQLQQAAREAAQAVTDARAQLADIMYRQGRYDKALREHGAEAVQRMVDRPPTPTRVGARYDTRVGRRPQPEDRAAAEDVLREAEQQLADVQAALAAAGPYSPLQAARDVGAPYYCGWPMTLADTKYLAGEPVSQAAIEAAGLDKQRLQTLIKWGTLREATRATN